MVYVMLNSGTKIDLPTELTTQQRIDFVKELTEKYPDDFGYHLPETNALYDNARLITMRLDTLAQYILDSTKNEGILTRYKSKKIKRNEFQADTFYTQPK